MTTREVGFGWHAMKRGDGRPHAPAAFTTLIEALADDVAAKYDGCVLLDLDDSFPVPSAARGVLLFVVSEAMSNAFRHGDPSKVTVSADGQRRTLTISDDGSGFNVMMRSPGHGLVEMRDRASSIGAQVCVRSMRQAGTSVELRFP